MRGALCFVDAEFSLFAKPFTIDGVVVAWGEALNEEHLLEPARPSTRTTGPLLLPPGALVPTGGRHHPVVRALAQRRACALGA